ncbi:hypothetical protein KEM55_005639 [Ascosphaera atra]|nr:hypothetical protein KEM55_005639 [Ascosphaera atra]
MAFLVVVIDIIKPESRQRTYRYVRAMLPQVIVSQRVKSRSALCLAAFALAHLSNIMTLAYADNKPKANILQFIMSAPSFARKAAIQDMLQRIQKLQNECQQEMEREAEAEAQAPPESSNGDESEHMMHSAAPINDAPEDAPDAPQDRRRAQGPRETTYGAWH